MKAVLLRAFGSPPLVETVPDPVPGTGEVIVDVVAADVLPYAADMLAGRRQYLLHLPVVPGTGGIGRVRATGPDATRLAPGDWVYCDPTIRARDDAVTPDMFLQGLTAGGPGGQRLQPHFGNGTWAEQVRLPTENAVPLGPIDAADAARWCGMGVMLVPYGGLLAAQLQLGETVLVSGATGRFGTAAIQVALAMGAAAVVAAGRNAAALADLAARFGSRVRTAAMTGGAPDRQAIAAAAQGPIDCVLDILPPMASPAQAQTAIMAVRPGGRVVLMGGVGMAGGPGLELPYPWIMRNGITIRGQWMYPAAAIPRMVRLVRADLLSLDAQEIAAFGLAEAQAAVAHAAAHAGPFQRTVILP